MRRVVEGKPVTIVTTYAALMTPQVLWEEKDIIHTERGGSLDESKLASRLVAMGYESLSGGKPRAILRAWRYCGYF